MLETCGPNGGLPVSTARGPRFVRAETLRLGVLRVYSGPGTSGIWLPGRRDAILFIDLVAPATLCQTETEKRKSKLSTLP